ncbi:MAG: DUF1559 domain-containing protein [Planctomycetes bacterium]|nr:DUF1559 domain-containing protein [Planctomycetota bacterium]MBL7042825.1 DUF1559 domain-containing protein [Pirellulaceae bacterium]
MNEFGLVLVWCAIQVTVLCAVSGLLYLLVRRIGPATASLTALTSLSLVVALSAFAFCPWPRWAAVPVNNDSSTNESDVTPAVPNTVVRNEAATPNNIDGVSDGPTTSSTAGEFFAAFWDELQRPAASTESTHSGWRWSASFALFFLIGSAFGLIRLIAGLISVRACRRESQPVVHTELLELVERLRTELQCRKTIDLRQSNSLTTAATIGWRRPLILLPADWIEWNSRERSVVLAHEIAHIRRNDFLAWVCAQVGLALHFYHPLVHWLARRLRLQQELAADADAAPFAGGQQPYLTTLAEMALRQRDHRLSWPARAFLPTRGTFLRRIEMLRNSKNVIPATSGRRRLAIITALFLAALAAAGFRGTTSTPSHEVLGGQASAAEAGRAPAERAAAEATPRRPKGDEPFSLAYVPRDVFVVGAVRPAKLLSHPESRALAETLGQDDILEKRIGIPLDRIEMATFFLLRRATLRGTANVDLAGIIARTKTSDDAKKIGNVYAPKAAKESYADQEYFRSDTNPRRFYFLPDERTVVTSKDVGFVRRIIIAGRTGASKTGWAETWQRMARSDAAVLYNLGGWKAEIQAEMERAPGPIRLQLATFAPLWQNTTAAAVGVKLDKQLTLQGVAECTTADDAKKVRDTLAAAITLGKNALSQLRESASVRSDADGPIILRAADAADAVLDNVTVEQKEETVTLAARTSIEDTATVAAALLDAVKAARSAARRAQSSNNLKQLALAFHNYHDVHKRFPPAVVIGPDGKTPHSWRVEVLPFLEQKALYDHYHMNEPWDSPHNKKVLETMPPVFRNPNVDPISTNTSYFALTSNGTVFSIEEGTRIRDISDGTSNTILLVEAKREIPWTKPEDIPYDPDKKIPQLGGFEEKTFLTAFCDGSVRTIVQSVSEKTLRALITIADGQNPGAF